MQEPIQADDFLQRVRPALEAGDAVKLAQMVRVRWRIQDIAPLLHHPHVDVRRVAAITLGLIGDLSSVAALVRALRDVDEQVNRMAEYGLWSIWFRAGKPQATVPFRKGVTLLAALSYEAAILHFQKAIALDDEFCEAHNQCGIAHYFLGQWEASLADCCRAIRLVPQHFGAIAGMGHCYAQLGDLSKALRCYRHALHINPRMPVIARAIERLRTRIKDSESSGEFLVDQIVG